MSSSILKDRYIRVLLLDQIRSCQLSTPGVFDVIDPLKRVKLLRAAKMPDLTVRFADGGIELVQLGHKFDVLAVDLVPVDGEISLAMPKGPRSYKGQMRLLRTNDGGQVINIVDMEEYLRGVVPAEVPGSFHAQALRAQAIAARTFAWYEKQTKGHSRNWDVMATESSQMYVGMSKEGKASEAEAAVRDTLGLVCTWDSPDGERIFCTYYSSTCGGCTQNAAPVKNVPAIPPLVGGVACDFCRDSPYYRWGSVRIDKERIRQRLCEHYPKFRPLGAIESMKVVESTPGGRPVRFEFRGGSGRTLELEAENFRLVIDPTGHEIRSTYFDPVVTPDAVVLENGRGWGHGLGLCQYGADGLAHTGRHAADILKFYYPGSHLTRAY